MPIFAFYKGKGDWVNLIIRVITRSQYSHCELVDIQELPKDFPFDAAAMSASGREGGVRCKVITFKREHWDFVEAHWAADNPAWDVMQREIGKGYDFWGLIGSQFFNFRLAQKSKWFCSEICAFALRLLNPNRYSPDDLKNAIEERNELFFKYLKE